MSTGTNFSQAYFMIFDLMFGRAASKRSDEAEAAQGYAPFVEPSLRGLTKGMLKRS